MSHRRQRPDIILKIGFLITASGRIIGREFCSNLLPEDTRTLHWMWHLLILCFNMCFSESTMEKRFQVHHVMFT